MMHVKHEDRRSIIDKAIVEARMKQKRTIRKHWAEIVGAIFFSQGLQLLLIGLWPLKQPVAVGIEMMAFGGSLWLIHKIINEIKLKLKGTKV